MDEKDKLDSELPGLAGPGNERFIERCLKHNIYNREGVHVLSVGTELTEKHLRLLELHQIELVETDVERVSSFSGGDGYSHRDLIEDGVVKIMELFEQIRYTKKIDVLLIRRIIIPIVQETTDNPDLYGLFAALQSKNDYLSRHTVGVAIISALIGRWLGMPDNEWRHLTIAATLHDIGMVMLPRELVDKPGRLSDKEYADMTRHTVFGYELIRSVVGMNEQQARVALQHHERLDGSGYPSQLAGDDIDFFSRIVAVADVFHAMSSRRIYKGAASFFDMLCQLQGHAFGALDPQIVGVLINRMMQSIVGKRVLLSDSTTGSIILINPHDPLRPLVRAGDAFHDLSKEPGLSIEQVIV